MLNRENRLILGKDFDLVYKNGRFFSFKGIVLKSLKNETKNTRIGLSIGIKFSPSAVSRNKIKRWIREIVKKHLNNLRSGFDIIIIPKKEKKFPTYQELAQDLESALQKGNLLVK